jgi:hypothetical protein
MFLFHLFSKEEAATGDRGSALDGHKLRKKPDLYFVIHSMTVLCAYEENSTSRSSRRSLAT